MDSDCLIKLTKAGLKERVCEAWEVSIPRAVKRETVEQAPHRPDAIRVKSNIEDGRLRVAGGREREARGEDAVLRLYTKGSFGAVATDDVRFIRLLRGMGVPYAVPAVIVVALRQEGVLTAEEAGQALTALRPHVSADEHAAAALMLSGGVDP